VTLTYLSKYATVVLNASGNGNAVLTPDTGQYWLPTLAHVGTASTALPTAGCSLHIGAPGALDFTTQIDYTFAGVSDTTGLVCSHVVFPGQAITAQFLGGNPGDTALLEIVGTSSDVPPTIGISPAFPGTEFSGSEHTTTIAGQPISVTVTNTPTVDIGGQPISVAETNKQLYANQPPMPFDSTLAIGGILHLLPATTGRTYYLHTIRLEASMVQNTYAVLQDTAATVIARILSQLIAAPATGFMPVLGLNHFNGAPLTAGLGLDLVNDSTAIERYVGYVTYSY
jgi:hypothetical protein